MASICKTSLLLLVVGVFGFRLSKALNDDVINEYLVRTVDNDNQTANFDALKVWLEDQEANVSFLNQGLIKDLKTLISLTTIQGDHNCNQDSYDILVASTKVTGGKAELFNIPYEKCRRIDKIVTKVAEQHALECQDVYVTRFYKRVSQMDKLYLEYVDDYMGRIRKSVKLPKTVSELEFKMGERTCYLAVIESRWNVFDSLTYITRDNVNKYPDFVREKDEHNKEKINKTKLIQLFKKYLLNPCEYYQRELSDIFIPAEYDAKRSHRTYKNDVLFSVGWSSFKFCSCLVNSDITPLIEGIVSVSASRQVLSKYPISKDGKNLF